MTTRYTTATWPSCSKEEKKSVAGNGRVCVSRQNNKMRKEKSQFHFSAFSCLAQINRIKIVFCVPPADPDEFKEAFEVSI